MKKILLFLSALLITAASMAQGSVPISGLPTYNGNPVGGWAPVVIAGVTRKVDPGLFAYKSFDSLAISYGTTIDTFRFYNRNSGVIFTGLYTKSAGSTIDTTSLSNRINGKVNIADTGNMLTPYLRSIFAVKYSDTAALLTPYERSILGVKYADTGAMLTPYVRSLLSVKYSDTSAMLTPYVRSILAVKYSDTASMLAHYYRTPLGTTLQYVLGNGGLATFPTNLSFFTNGPGYLTSIPNTAVTPGSYTNLNATIGADGRITAAANGSGGSGGSQILTHPQPDSIMLSSGGEIVDRDDNFNHPILHLGLLKNFPSAVASVRDSTNYGSADTVIASEMDLGHSFIDNGYWNQESIQLWSSKGYQIAGPGWVGGNATNFGFGGLANSGWTLRSAFTSPLGRGPDMFSWVAGSVGSTIGYSVSATAQPWTSWNKMTVLYWDTATGGTVATSIDGVVIDTINFATGTHGLSTHTYFMASNTKHLISFKTITTGNSEILGTYDITMATRGLINNKVGQGSTQLTDILAQDSTLQSKEWQFIGSNMVHINYVVNSIVHGGYDTVNVYSQLDRLVKRVKAALPNADILIENVSDYGYTRWGTPPQPIVAYNRAIRRLAYADSVSLLDFYSIMGTFPFSKVINTISGDSLHPQYQSVRQAVGAVYGAMGIFNLDQGVPIHNLLTEDSSLSTNSAATKYWNLNSKGLKLNNLTALTLSDGTHIATITPGAVVATTGATTSYTWDNAGSFTSLTATNATGSNKVGGHLYVGNTGGVEDFGVHSSLHNYTQVAFAPTAIVGSTNGYDWLQFENEAGTEYGRIFHSSTTAGVGVNGALYMNNATFYGTILGNAQYGNSGSSDTTELFSGGGAIANKLISLWPNGNTSILGSISHAYVAKTANYTAGPTDYLIDCTSGSFTVTLPTAVGITGRQYIITNSGGGTITMATTSSQTINGTTPGTVSTLLRVFSDGANWKNF